MAAVKSFTVLHNAVYTVNPHYTIARYNDKIRFSDNLTSAETLSQELIVNQKYAGALLFNTSRDICFGYFLESPH